MTTEELLIVPYGIETREYSSGKPHRTETFNRTLWN